MELIGLYLIAAGLLVVAGIAKTLHPDDTARAMGTLLPLWTPRPLQSLGLLRQSIRVLALTEVAVGLAALTRAGPLTGILVASSYVLFACVVAYARVRGGPLATCGCFGRPHTPATWLHVVLNLVLAGAALGVATGSGGGGSIAAVLAHQPWAGAPLLFASAVGLGLTMMALSTLPVLEGARRARPARTGTGAGTGAGSIAAGTP
jgi:Methylamine utilisation protein MauE